MASDLGKHNAVKVLSDPCGEFSAHYDDFGMSPLTCAICQVYFPVIKPLSEKGCPLDDYDKYGISPVHVAFACALSKQGLNLPTFLMSFSPTVSCLENGFDMLSTRKCRGEEKQVESAEGRVILNVKRVKFFLDFHSLSTLELLGYT